MTNKLYSKCYISFVTLTKSFSLLLYYSLVYNLKYKYVYSHHIIHARNNWLRSYHVVSDTNKTNKVLLPSQELHHHNMSLQEKTYQIWKTEKDPLRETMYTCGDKTIWRGEHMKNDWCPGKKWIFNSNFVDINPHVAYMLKEKIRLLSGIFVDRGADLSIKRGELEGK